MENIALVRSYNYKIRSFHVDNRGHLFLHHLFNLLQDVAHTDANSLGFGTPQLMGKGRFWVLSRLTLEILELPTVNSEVVIKTWVKSVSEVRSEREFTVEVDEKQLIRVSTMWFCLAAKDHRPAPIPGKELLEQVANNEYAVVGGARKVRAINGNPSEGILLIARPSDIDLVNHVNNAAYVRWLMDEAYLAMPENEIASFTINYRNEVFLGDEVHVRHKIVEDRMLVQEVVARDSDKTVCLAETVYKI